MKCLCIILSVIFYTNGLAQDSLRSKLQIGGYVKDLQTFTFQENFRDVAMGNLVHHRLNLRWRPADKLTTALEVRNRIFFGNEVGSVSDFSRRLRNKNEALRLTWDPVEHDNMLFNVSIDRLWIEYERKKWILRVGRQRINWGIGTTWNPNDIFNTFDFLDFDYEERPGIDGIKFQYLTGGMDHVESSISFSQNADSIVAAVRYFKNIANYDLQFIAGLYYEQPTLGFGWSGSIRETGFKGELQYFFQHNRIGDHLNISIEADHVLPKGWYLNLGAFLNSGGSTTSDALFQPANIQFSPRNLMPTRWNSSFILLKELSPLFTVNLSTIYSPNANLLIFVPLVTCSATKNLDINLIWQSFFVNQGGSFDDLLHRCFLRFKWSY